jgi:hypothetical protein
MFCKIKIIRHKRNALNELELKNVVEERDNHIGCSVSTEYLLEIFEDVERIAINHQPGDATDTLESTIMLLLEVADRVDSTTEHEENCSFRYTSERLLEIEILMISYHASHETNEEVKNEDNNEREQLISDWAKKGKQCYSDAC